MIKKIEKISPEDREKIKEKINYKKTAKKKLEEMRTLRIKAAKEMMGINDV
jgi:hypothetical protein